MEFLDGLLAASFLIIMLVGLLGLLIPIFPGGIIIWLTSLVYGLINGFEGVGAWLFGVITILMLIGTFGDNILMGKIARDKGGSWIAIILGLLAGIIGTLFFPPFGGIISAPSMLFLVEYIRLRDAKVALSITRGLLIGWGWSFLMRFGLGVVMILLWGYWAWTNLV